MAFVPFGTLKQRRILRASLFLATGLLLPFGRVAGAQEAGHWTWEVSPYLWGADLRGTIQAGPGSVPLTASFSDRLNHLEFGLKLDVEARSGRWGVLLEPFYVDFDRAVSTRSGAYTQIDSMQLQADLAGTYRISESCAASVDAILGARYNQLNTVLKSQGFPSSEWVRSWVDPFVGGRVAVMLNDRWSWRLRADAGGFNAGSRDAWSANTQFRFQIAQSTALAMGYGIISTDYWTGRGSNHLRYDVRIGGPFIGVTFRL